MAFRVKVSKMLQEETDRIQSILLSPHFRGRVWEEEEFFKHLASIGLEYSQEELMAIREELISRGVVESVE